MQEKLEKVIVKQHFHIFKQILIRAGGTWRGTQILAKESTEAYLSWLLIKVCAYFCIKK